MKFIDLYKIYIILILFSACSGSKMNDRGLNANRNAEHKSKTYFLPDLNSTDIDSSSIKPKPGNSPNTEPTEDDEEENHELIWI